MLIRSLLAAALLCLSLALVPWASARELTPAEKAGLAEAVAAFDQAMRTKDVPAIIGVVPPKVFERMAADNGIPKEALAEELIKLTEQVLADVKFESFSMDLDAAVYKETPDGVPYALIPTDTLMDFGQGGKIQAKSQTFAMLDEGVWYLVRTDDATTVTVLKQTYPSYAAEDFPAGTMEPVTP